MIVSDSLDFHLFPTELSGSLQNILQLHTHFYPHCCVIIDGWFIQSQQAHPPDLQGKRARLDDAIKEHQSELKGGKQRVNI